MITPEKIEEWIKEAEERPASAAILIQYIANRLRDLTARNEELLAENIALRTEKRVEEYEQRIVHLEYQLELLRRQYGGQLPIAATTPAPARAPEPVSFLVYDARGHVLRLASQEGELMEGQPFAILRGLPSRDEEALRLLAVPASEELLFVFSSGRVASLAASAIPPAEKPNWAQAAAPHEPRGGETLACLMPISKMALAEWIIQVSRRGYVKKMMTSLASSILSKHYIGTGVIVPSDHTHQVLLAGKEERLGLVSRNGYLLCLDLKDLPFAVEEGIRLANLDVLEAAFTLSPGQPVVAMTQVGKLVQWPADRLEPASLKSRGQPLFSAQRRESGVRVIAAAAAREADWAAALHANGQLSLHSIGALSATGTIPVQGELLAFTVFTRP